MGQPLWWSAGLISPTTPVIRATPPEGVVVDRLTKLALRLPQHHVATVTTNVPGPRVPLTCLGRRVETFLPYVPIADRVQLGVAMFSYRDELVFGFSADADVADLDVLADGVAEAWRELAATRVVVEGPGSGGRRQA